MAGRRYADPALDSVGARSRLRRSPMPGQSMCQAAEDGLTGSSLQLDSKSNL